MSYKLNDNITLILESFRRKTIYPEISSSVSFLYDFLDEEEKIKLIKKVEEDPQISEEIKFSFLNDILTMPDASENILSAIEVISRNKKKSEAATLLYKTVYHPNYVGDIFNIKRNMRALKEKEQDITNEKTYYIQPKYSFFNLKHKNITVNFCINLLYCFESVKCEEMRNNIMKNSLARLDKAQQLQQQPQQLQQLRQIHPELQHTQHQPQHTQQVQQIGEMQNDLNNYNNALIDIDENIKNNSILGSCSVY